MQGAHAQTVLASLKLFRPLVLWRNRAALNRSQALVLELPEANARLQVHLSLQDDPAPLAVLLPGWEGSHQSLYLLDLTGHLFEQGYSVARLNLRDHGGSHHLNRELFHSNRLDEVIEAVEQLAGSYLGTGQHLCLAGFSLGGNFAARVARHAPQHLPLHSTCAVSPVINPILALERMNSASGIYRRYFQRKWQQSIRAKRAAWPDAYDFDAALKLQSMSELTDYLVSGYTDYPSTRDYLQAYSIGGDRLQQLQRPLHILAAQDDPVLGNNTPELAASEWLQIQTTAHGGHCGFFVGFSRGWYCKWVAHCFALPLWGGGEQ